MVWPRTLHVSMSKGGVEGYNDIDPTFFPSLGWFGQFQLFTDVLEIGLRSEW